jgi:hypothetical protein
MSQSPIIKQFGEEFSSHFPEILHNDHVSCNAKISDHHDPNRKETQAKSQHPAHLDSCLVSDRHDGLRYVVLHRNGPRLPWHQRLSLQVNVCSLSLRLLLQFGVLLDSADELFSGAGKGDVLDSEVDALLDVPVLHLLVDDDTDCALRDVIDNAGLSMVDLVRHSTVPSVNLTFMTLWKCY